MCDAIKQTCDKTYSFSPFWEGSILRKNARDQLCKICGTLKIYAFTDDMKSKLEQKGLTDKEILDFNRDSISEQVQKRDSFLQQIAYNIETSKEKNMNPPTIENIRERFDYTQREIAQILVDNFKGAIQYKQDIRDVVDMEVHRATAPYGNLLFPRRN